MTENELEFHPMADIFPMLDPKALGELANDIAENGLREPIILYEGRILDGRNRYQACLMAGAEPETEKFYGDDPLGFVVSANLHRRHLNDEQRAKVAAKIATMKQGARTDLSPNGGMSQADAAKALDVSKRQVERATKVIKEGVPELVAAVERGGVSLSAAAAVAGRPVEEQRAIVAAGPAAIVEAGKAKRLTKAEKADPVAGPVIEVRPRLIEGGGGPYYRPGKPTPEYLKARKALRKNTYDPIQVRPGRKPFHYEMPDTVHYEMVDDEDRFLLSVAAKVEVEGKCRSVRVIVVDDAAPDPAVVEPVDDETPPAAPLTTLEGVSVGELVAWIEATSKRRNDAGRKEMVKLLQSTAHALDHERRFINREKRAAANRVYNIPPGTGTVDYAVLRRLRPDTGDAVDRGSDTTEGASHESP